MCLSVLALSTFSHSLDSGVPYMKLPNTLPKPLAGAAKDGAPWYEAFSGPAEVGAWALRMDSWGMKPAKSKVYGFTRLEKVHARLEKVHARLVKAHARLEKVHARLVKARAWLEKVRARLVKAHARLVKVHARLEKVRARLVKAHARLVKVHARLVKVRAWLMATSQRRAMFFSIGIDF